MNGVGVLGTSETLRFGVNCSILVLSLKPDLHGRFGVPSFSLFEKGNGRLRGDPLRVRWRGVDEDRGVALRKREGENSGVKFLNDFDVITSYRSHSVLWRKIRVFGKSPYFGKNYEIRKTLQKALQSTFL